MNFAFYVSGKAGRLHRLFEDGDTEVLGSTKLIFSDDKDTTFLENLAAERGIEYKLMDFTTIKKTATKKKSVIMSDELLRLLREHNIDYCFSFGAHILGGELLEPHAYENKIINFHPSILPAFPGLMAIDQALEANTVLLGNTAHFIDAGIDTGAIIMQNVVSRKLFDQGGYDAILDQQLIMIRQIAKWLKAGRISVDGSKVSIAEADYNLSNFYPRVELP